MGQLLRVPEVAAGASEVVLSEWLVVEGTEVALGAPIAVVETEKATVEIESEAAATLLRTLALPGASIDVGAPMALLGTSEEVGREDELLAELGAAVPEHRAAPPRREVPEAEAESPTGSPAAPRVDPEPQPESGPRAEAAALVGAAPRRIFMTPLARKILASARLAPEDVHGTGPHGRITKRDTERAIAARAEASRSAAPAVPAAPVPAAPVDSQAGAPDGRAEPHTRLRRAIASRLTRSKRDVPHFYLKRTAVVDDLLALRARINEHSPVRVSVNDLVVRAVALAHAAVPGVNAIWTDDATVYFDAVDVSVAVASERGLVTPVVRDVSVRSVSSVASTIRDLAERANAGRLQQHELEGGSITVTNLGMYGVEEFAAIINPPQACILAVGAGRQAPIVRDGEIGVATQLALVLSVDHRVVDGALAATWFEALIEVLEHPFRLVV